MNLQHIFFKVDSLDNDPNYNGSFKFGDFGTAKEEVAKEAGKPDYNVQISIWNGILSPKGIVSDDKWEILSLFEVQTKKFIGSIVLSW